MLETSSNLVEVAADFPNIFELQAGSNTFDVLAIEHDRQTFNAFKTEILVTIEQHQVIIPEYFPPEWSQNIRGITNLSYDRNHLFYKIEAAAAEGKDFYVVDPAYTAEHEAIVWIGRGLENTAAVFSVQYPLWQVIQNFQKLQITRRSFLNLGLSVMATLATSKLAFNILSNSRSEAIEKDFRRVVIAENICQLPQLAGKPLLVYPREHMAGIQHYIENPDKRKERVLLYRALAKLINLDDSCFQVRHYIKGDQKWQRAAAENYIK